jgi:Tol biopolymer transport system component
MSAHGRHVAFQSAATNLVPGDTNRQPDIFVRDRFTGNTERVSVTSRGGQSNGDSGSPTISNDGRYVAFYSSASNLVAGDTNDAPDVFLHDRKTGVTSRVSLSSAGRQGNGLSLEAAISGNGRHIAFLSEASNLVVGDTNGVLDVFVRDLHKGKTIGISVSSRSGKRTT